MLALTKPGILSLVLLTFGILVTFAPSTDAYKCYVCDAPDCDNLREESCSKGEPGTHKFSCERADGAKANGRPYKFKGCANDIYKDGDCRISEEEDLKDVRKCYCNKDLCNGNDGGPGGGGGGTGAAGTPSLLRQSTFTWLTTLAACVVLKQQYDHFSLL